MADRRSGLGCASAAITLAVLLVASLAVPKRAAAQDAEAFDTLGVLHAIDMAPAKLLLGTGFRVEDPVPTDGLSPRFTIRSEVGIFEAWGVETLAIRVAEIPAIQMLDRAAHADVFGRAAAEMAATPVQPPASGLDRFFAASDPGPAKIAVADRDERLRAVARRLGVDPYTTNPLLAVRLEQFAEVSARSGIAASTLLRAATPSLIAMPGSEVAHHLVYDTPGAELIEQNAERMRGFGASDDQIRAFQSAPGFTLTTQTALVESLARLDHVQGRAEAVALAATAVTPDQALFLVRAVGILADRNEQAPIDVLLARGTLVARQKSGQIIAPIPADYVAWTENMARFAQREDLAAPERGVWISGRTTSRARQRFEELGWAVHEGVKP